MGDCVLKLPLNPSLQRWGSWFASRKAARDGDNEEYEVPLERPWEFTAASSG